MKELTPHEKSQELIDKFGDLAKDVVDEILNVLDYCKQTSTYKTWQEVKQEIIKL